MLPIATDAARAALLGTLLIFALAIGSQSWVAAVLGSVLALGLATCFAASLPLGRRVRREKLEFAWWLSHAGNQGTAPISGAVIPGVPFQVRCYIRHRGSRPLKFGRVQPIVAEAVQWLDPEPAALTCAARARTEFSFTLSAPCAGRVVLHGLSVSLRGPFEMFEVPLYFPNAIAIKVLPRTVAISRPLPAAWLGLPIDRQGRQQLRIRGGGTELHELREFVSGDPFKSIAWKASARSGKLLVREVEQEVQQTLVLVLDAGGSMRGGEPGKRRLDFALEWAAAHARSWLDRGDRVALCIVDDEQVGWLAPGEGPAQLMRVYEALLSTTEVVDADLTALDDGEVVDLVARYVRQQDGLDYSARAGERWDVPALVAHARSAERSTVEPPRAPTAAGSELRAFCRNRGLALPHRAGPRSGDKVRGFIEALERAGARVRDPRAIVVLTDLEDLHDYGALRPAIGLLRRNGHKTSFVVPDLLTPTPASHHAVGAELEAIYAHGERRRLQRAREALTPLGVPVLNVAGVSSGVRPKAPGTRRVA